MKIEYELLTVATIPEYVAGKAHLAKKIDTSTLVASDVSDGNLNLVFLCRDGDGQGLCLKQSLPYVRLVGDAWPLTPERVIAETRGYEAATEASPDDVPEFYGLDQSRYIIAMENLDHLVIWRAALNDGVIHEGVGAQLGRFVARLAFSTSLFNMHPLELKQRTAASVNPELCKITEDLVFTEPYGVFEHNSYQPEVGVVVDEIRADRELVAQVGILKTKFMTCGEALIHGDLHTGSVMVTVDADEPYGKVIDPEFCFYGPVGFDLGALFGNYLAAQARSVVLARSADFRRWTAKLISETWYAFEAEMWTLWPQRSETFFTDDFLRAWLLGVLQDATGFGGCKANRRIIGLAKVSDIETLEGNDHLAAATGVLCAASRWIKERSLVSTPEQIETIAAEELSRTVSG